MARLDGWEEANKENPIASVCFMIHLGVCLEGEPDRKMCYVAETLRAGFGLIRWCSMLFLSVAPVEFGCLCCQVSSAFKRGAFGQRTKVRVSSEVMFAQDCFRFSGVGKCRRGRRRQLIIPSHDSLFFFYAVAKKEDNSRCSIFPSGSVSTS